MRSTIAVLVGKADCRGVVEASMVWWVFGRACWERLTVCVLRNFGSEGEVKGRDCGKARDRRCIWPTRSVRGRKPVRVPAARGLRNRLLASCMRDLSCTVLPHLEDIMLVLVFCDLEIGVRSFPVLVEMFVSRPVHFSLIALSRAILAEA
jgi:hypothetical protein